MIRSMVRRAVVTVATAVVAAGLVTAAGGGTTTAGSRPADRAAPVRVKLAADLTSSHVVATSPLVTAVSRATDKLDAFAVGPDNKIYTAAWEPGFTDGWHGWWSLNGGVAAPNTSVGSVSPATDKLDAFAVGTDHHAYWADWAPGYSSWHGWAPLDSPELAPDTSITAVSRGTDRMDIFAVGADYVIYTESYDPWTGWQGWQALAGGSAAPGTTVYGVSRGPGKVDVFAVRGGDRHIVTAAWDDAAAGWRGWWEVAGGVAAPNTSVTAVSRGADLLDIFAVGTDGQVYTAAWEPDFTDWHGWWNVNGLQVAAGTSVFGASQGGGGLDIYAVGADNVVQTASWHPDFDSWHGWWPLNGKTAEPGTSVFAVSRSGEHLDVFAIDANSGIYTAAWQSDNTDWYHGWWPVAQLLSIQGSAIVVFPSGIAVGGTANAAFFPDGTYTFSARLQSTAFLPVVPWQVETAMTLEDVATGTAFVVHDQATVWTNSGWNQVGSDGQIAAYWAGLSTNYRLFEHSTESVDWLGLLGQIVSIYGDINKAYDASAGDTQGTDMPDE